MKVKYICPECGSDGGVLADAFACWNEDKQEWELHDTYDDASCNDCGANFDVWKARKEEE